MKNAILKLEFVPKTCMECVLSTYKVYEKEQGFFCAAFESRVPADMNNRHKDCPLVAVDDSDFERVTHATTELQQREEVKAFAMAMEKELLENDYKGGWKDCSLKFLFDKLIEEIEELRYEVYSNKLDKGGIRSEAADVGNIVMMIADVCGALLKEGQA